MRIILIAALISFFFAAPVSAEDDFVVRQEKTEKHVQKIIEQCKSLSKEDWDSGVTGRMMQGSDNYSSCLVENIENLSNSFFKREEDKKDFLKALNQYRADSNEVYWLLHNTHRGCTPCGTIYQGFHLNDTSAALEKVLKTMILDVYEFDLIIDK